MNAYTPPGFLPQYYAVPNQNPARALGAPRQLQVKRLAQNGAGSIINLKTILGAALVVAGTYNIFRKREKGKTILKSPVPELATTVGSLLGGLILLGEGI